MIRRRTRKSSRASSGAACFRCLWVLQGLRCPCISQP
nr:MAG TPA: hypothetical protein [Caudoviricetes sp.]